MRKKKCAFCGFSVWLGDGGAAVSRCFSPVFGLRGVFRQTMRIMMKAVSKPSA